MARTIISVIAAFLLVQVLVFLILTGAWMIVGADGAFREDTWNLAPTWTWTMLGAGLAASIAGGVACLVMAGRGNAVMHLAIISLITGVLPAVAPKPEPPAGAATRPADVGMFEAMTSARPPAWQAWAAAVLAPAGVLLGGRMLLASARRGEMAAGTAAASGDPDGCGCGCGTCSGAADGDHRGRTLTDAAGDQPVAAASSGPTRK